MIISKILSSAVENENVVNYIFDKRYLNKFHLHLLSYSYFVKCNYVSNTNYI